MKQKAFYTKETAKAFKGKNAETVFCWIDESYVYLSNAFVIYRMPESTYNELFLPVLKTAAGNWTIKYGEKVDGDGTQKRIRDIWKKAVDKYDEKRAQHVMPLLRMPYEWTTDDAHRTNIALHYSADADFSIGFNSDFIAFGCPVDIYADSPINPAVVYAGIDENGTCSVRPVALVVPMRLDGQLARATRSYFVGGDGSGNDVENVTETYAGKLREKDERIAELENTVRRLEAQLADAKNAAPVEAEMHDAPVVDLEQKTRAVLATVEKLGCKATLKGAKTARPVVWIENGENAADALKAHGAMFSRKRNAYYIAVA